LALVVLASNARRVPVLTDEPRCSDRKVCCSAGVSRAVPGTWPSRTRHRAPCVYFCVFDVSTTFALRTGFGAADRA